MSMIIWVMTGTLAGWFTGLLIRNTSLGAVGDLAVGVLGGLVGGYGGYLVSQFGILLPNWFSAVSAAAIGGVSLVWILHRVHPGVTIPL